MLPSETQNKKQGKSLDLDVYNLNSVHTYKIIISLKMVFVLLLWYKIINRTNI